MVAAIICGVRSIRLSEEFAALLFFSLAGLDLSLWLLSKGVGLMQYEPSNIPMLLGP